MSLSPSWKPLGSTEVSGGWSSAHRAAGVADGHRVVEPAVLHAGRRGSRSAWRAEVAELRVRPFRPRAHDHDDRDDDLVLVEAHERDAGPEEHRVCRARTCGTVRWTDGDARWAQRASHECRPPGRWPCAFDRKPGIPPRHPSATRRRACRNDRVNSQATSRPRFSRAAREHGGRDRQHRRHHDAPGAGRCDDDRSQQRAERVAERRRDRDPQHPAARPDRTPFARGAGVLDRADEGVRWQTRDRDGAHAAAEQPGEQHRLDALREGEEPIGIPAASGCVATGSRHIIQHAGREQQHDLDRHEQLARRACRRAQTAPPDGREQHADRERHERRQREDHAVAVGGLAATTTTRLPGLVGDEHLGVHEARDVDAARDRREQSGEGTARRRPSGAAAAVELTRPKRRPRAAWDRRARRKSTLRKSGQWASQK